MLADKVTEQLKRLGVEILDKPKRRRVDISHGALPPALGQFLYCLNWPENIAYAVKEIDDSDEDEMWMMNLAYEPLEHLTEGHGSCYDGEYLMCGIYDGGNYLLVVKPTDTSDDPEVSSLDHDDDGTPFHTYRLSDLLSRMEPEPPDKYADQEPKEMTPEEQAESDKRFEEFKRMIITNMMTEEGMTKEEAEEELGFGPVDL